VLIQKDRNIFLGEKKQQTAFTNDTHDPFFSREFITSLQISFAVTIASLFCLIPSLASHFTNPYWAALTVTFVIEKGRFASVSLDEL
jgi:hypothetical protein